MGLTELLVGRRIVLAANIVDGYPSEFEYTRDFLLREGCDRLITVSSPLEKRSKPRSVISRYSNGSISRQTIVPHPIFLPYSHSLSFLIPPIPFRHDIWIGFNPVMTAIGALSSRRATLVNWAIDFVPTKGKGTSELAYRMLERFMMKRLDIQIENTFNAMNERTNATGHVPPVQLLAPIGVWGSAFAAPTQQQFMNRTVVYFGSLDGRNGSPFLVDLFRDLLQADPSIRIEVVGDGPQAPRIRTLSTSAPDRFVFHGYIENQDEINEILRRSTLAVAPYDETPGQFTSFADPQKLKYYAANSLHVLMTDVAPAARVMAEAGAATLLSASEGVAKWRQIILEFLNSKDKWSRAANGSFAYSRAFDREAIYKSTFHEILTFGN